MFYVIGISIFLAVGYVASLYILPPKGDRIQQTQIHGHDSNRRSSTASYRNNPDVIKHRMMAVSVVATMSPIIVWLTLRLIDANEQVSISLGIL
jgi:hypothetical protein